MTGAFHLIFTCSKPTRETLENDVKSFSSVSIDFEQVNPYWD